MPLTLSFEPVLLEAGGSSVRWSTLLTLVAVATGIGLSARSARRGGANSEAIALASGLALLGGLAAGRAAFAISNWELFLGRPDELWRVPLHGLSTWGALLGGAVAAWLALAGTHPGRATVADAVLPGLVAGYGLTRLAGLLDGVGQGLPSNLPWATVYTSQHTFVPDFGVARHPLPAYGALAALLALAVTRLGGRLPAGGRWWLFLALFGAGSAWLADLSLDPAFVFGLRLEQILAGGAAVFAASRLGLALLHQQRWRGAPA